MSNSLDPDQDQCSVGPDQGPKLFAKVKVISRRQKLQQARKELKKKLISLSGVKVRSIMSRDMRFSIMWHFHKCRLR